MNALVYNGTQQQQQQRPKQNQHRSTKEKAARRGNWNTVHRVGKSTKAAANVPLPPSLSRSVTMTDRQPPRMALMLLRRFGAVHLLIYVYAYGRMHAMCVCVGPQFVAKPDSLEAKRLRGAAAGGGGLLASCGCGNDDADDERGARKMLALARGQLSLVRRRRRQRRQRRRIYASPSAGRGRTHIGLVRCS